MEVLRRLRRTSDIPVIILTSKDEEIDEILGFNLGADDYMHKPFSQRLLIERVKAVLRRARADQEAEAAGGAAGAAGANAQAKPSVLRKIKLIGFNDFHGQLSTGKLVGTRAVGGAAVMACISTLRKPPPRMDRSSFMPATLSAPRRPRRRCCRTSLPSASSTCWPTAPARPRAR